MYARLVALPYLFRTLAVLLEGFFAVYVVLIWSDILQKHQDDTENKSELVSNFQQLILTLCNRKIHLWLYLRWS